MVVSCQKYVSPRIQTTDRFHVNVLSFDNSTVCFACVYKHPAVVSKEKLGCYGVLA